jgi:hypothetical protein
LRARRGQRARRAIASRVPEAVAHRLRSRASAGVVGLPLDRFGFIPLACSQ